MPESASADQEQEMSDVEASGSQCEGIPNDEQDIATGYSDMNSDFLDSDDVEPFCDDMANEFDETVFDHLVANMNDWSHLTLLDSV